MTSIVSYKKIVTPGPNGTTIELVPPRDENGAALTTELAALDGVTYVAVPDGATLPEQPEGIDPQPITLTPPLAAQISAVSPHVALIRQRQQGRATDAPLSAERAELWAQQQLQALGLATDDDVTDAALGVLAARRYQAEIAGTTWGGHPVATDRQSQALITAALVGSQLPGAPDTDWKMADGTFVTLAPADVQAMALAAKTHVQACFDHEKALAAQVRTDIATDIEQGWPA